MKNIIEIENELNIAKNKIELLNLKTSRIRCFKK